MFDLKDCGLKKKSYFTCAGNKLIKYDLFTGVLLFKRYYHN